MEHATARDLIAQLSAMTPDDELYDAKVTVLAEYIRHHVEEEEAELFPKLRKSSIDFGELTAKMKTRKRELRAVLQAHALS